MKRILRYLVYGYKSSSEKYIEHLKKRGVKVRDGVNIFRPANTTIDLQNPHMLEIGDYVQITGPVTILTHDYSWSVLKRKFGEVVGNQNNVIIGDNCFIGWGATILAGTTIGDNVIIGANSVVKGKLDADSVYAGNPAKKIMTLEEFYIKRKNKQENEAINYINRFINTYKKEPTADDLNEYFFLFSNKIDDNNKRTINQIKCMGNEKFTKKILEKNTPKYSSFEELLIKAKVRGKNEK